MCPPESPFCRCVVGDKHLICDLTRMGLYQHNAKGSRFAAVAFPSACHSGIGRWNPSTERKKSTPGFPGVQVRMRRIAYRLTLKALKPA